VVGITQTTCAWSKLEAVAAVISLKYLSYRTIAITYNLHFISRALKQVSIISTAHEVLCATKFKSFEAKNQVQTTTYKHFVSNKQCADKNVTNNREIQVRSKEVWNAVAPK